MDLEKLFYPESLAVIGASDKEGKLGYNVLRNLLDHEYEGRIYPVNPKYDEIQGLKAYESVKEIEGNLDSAVSIVPASYTPDVVEECFEAGAEFVSVQAAGFGEKGGEGKEIEDQLRELVEEYDSHILGPNCTGVINVNNGLCQAIGRVEKLDLGNIGLIAQAGVYAAGILWGLKDIMDFSMIATIGNKMDIDETDVLKYMGNENTVDVIAMYMEDTERGGDFLDIARETVKDKPIVLLKGGRTEEGKKSAATHTGSIGGPREVYETIFKEGRIIQADDNDHMFDITRAFSKQPLPTTDKMMIITYSGSQGITATDTLNEEGLGLAELQDSTEEKIVEMIPDIIEGTNPADLTFDQYPEQVRKIIEIAKEDEEVGGFIVNLQPEILQSYVDEFSKLDSGGKPVLTSVTGKEFIMDTVVEIENLGYPIFATPERAARVVSEMWRYKSREIEDLPREKFEVEEEKVGNIIDSARSVDREVIGGFRALEIFEAYGIPVVKHHLAKTPEEASKIFEELEGPFAMKIESKEITHKSDVGGVELNVEGDPESAFRELKDRVLSETGIEEDQIEGVTIQPMITEGKEILIGSTYEDIVDGHMIRFGFGGKYTEIFRDTSTRIAPLDSKDAEEMIEETEYIKELLRGARGDKPCDEGLIKESLLRLSQLVEDFPEVKEVEANPLLIWQDGAAVIDARLRLSEKHKKRNQL